MGKIPSGLSYIKVVAALQRDGWVVVRHKATSHIQLQKRAADQVDRLTLSAQRPVPRQTLAKVLKQARITPDRFLELL